MTPFRSLVVSSCLLAVGLPAWSRHAAASSDEDLVARVRAEASRIATTPASQMFKTLADDDRKAPQRLTKQQVELSARLDKLVRAVLMTGLLRGLDSGTPPPPSELPGRLGEAGKREREAVVSNAEAMVLGVILNPDQARQLQKALGQSNARVLPGRYGPFRLTGCMLVQSLEVFKLEINRKRQILDHDCSSSLFHFVTNYVKTPGKLSREQVELSDRLDRLNRAALTDRLSRNMPTDGGPGSDEDAANWFNAWNQRRNSFVAHAEAIFIRGILSPPQAEALLVSYWSSMGPLALTDPELAARLNLSEAQRSALLEQFDKRVSLEEEEAGLMALLASKARDELGRSVSELAKAEKNRLRAEADWTVWSVLTQSQLKKLRQILRTDVVGPQPPVSPKRTKRSGRKKMSATNGTRLLH